MSVGRYFISLNTLGSMAFWKNTQANGIRVQPELAPSNLTPLAADKKVVVSVTDSLSSLST